VRWRRQRRQSFFPSRRRPVGWRRGVARTSTRTDAHRCDDCCSATAAAQDRFRSQNQNPTYSTTVFLLFPFRNVLLSGSSVLGISAGNSQTLHIKNSSPTVHAADDDRTGTGPRETAPNRVVWAFWSVPDFGAFGPYRGVRLNSGALVRRTAARRPAAALRRARTRSVSFVGIRESRTVWL